MVGHGRGAAGVLGFCVAKIDIIFWVLVGLCDTRVGVCDFTVVCYLVCGCLRWRL